MAVLAIDSKIRLSARRSRLNGTDMPVVTIRQASDDLELNRKIRARLDELEQIKAQLRERPAILPGQLADDDDDAPSGRLER